MLVDTKAFERVCNDVANERLRQIVQLGHTPQRDDNFTGGELVAKACSYARSGIGLNARRACLVRAAALLFAEIERMDRVKENKT